MSIVQDCHKVILAINNDDVELLAKFINDYHLFLPTFRETLEKIKTLAGNNSCGKIHMYLGLLNHLIDEYIDDDSDIDPE